MPKGLKPPHPRDRRPPCRVSLVPSDGRQHVEPGTVARPAVDAEVLAIDRDRVRPPVAELPGAHEPCADIDPVRDQLPLVRRRPTTPIWIARGDPTRLAPRDLCRRPIARPLRDRHQCLANLTRREPVLPSARLTLPRLKSRRALNAERIRLPLPRQNRREPVLRIPVRRPTPPPLPTMPRPSHTNHPEPPPNPRAPGTGHSGISTARRRYPCNRTYPLKSSKDTCSHRSRTDRRAICRVSESQKRPVRPRRSASGSSPI